MNRYVVLLMAQWDRARTRHSARSPRRHPGHGLFPYASGAIALEIERIEPRILMSADGVLAKLIATPTYEVVPSAGPAQAYASTGPTGYSPSQIQAAYGFNKLSLSSGANGAGQTIAIVDAYHSPTMLADLQAFDRAFGLADPPSLTIVSQTGSTTGLPQTDPTKGWELEAALDVEWAHALAPAAKIVLVEANSASYADLLAAVHTAAGMPGVSVVSMSWGGGEFSSEASYDSVFTTPAGHQGVTFVASTGDNGAPGGFPAYSRNVIAVGGTTLTLGSSAAYISESGWSGSGGGVSQYESQPTYQNGIVTQTTTKRSAPDVSFDADPNTGVAVYSSFSNGSSSPWAQVGGTSFSAPSWGAIVAIVDQARSQSGLSSLDGATQTLPMLYNLSKTTPSAFHDVTSGSNGYTAGAGYDLVTGLGSPVVNVLVNALSGTTTSTSKLVFQSSPVTGTAGQVLSPTLKVQIQNADGQVVTTDNSIVTLSISSGPGSFTSSSTVSVRAVNGVATFNNLVLNTAGTYKLSASDGNMAAAVSGSLTVSPASASKVVFLTGPANTVTGQTLAPVTVAVEDSFGNVVTADHSTITISVASGPGALANTSTVSVQAVNGVATFNKLILATTGTYTLRASDGALISAVSSTFTIGATLASPQNVIVVALSTTAAKLSWNAVSGTQGYRIFQVIGTQSYLLGTVSSSTTAVQVTGITAGSRVSFKVEAYNSSTVADSAVVSVTMPSVTLNAPTVTVRATSASTALLTWTAVAGTQGYRVYYLSGGVRTLLGAVSANVTSLNITGMSGGTGYQFQIEAYSGTTVSDSAWVAVTMPSNKARASDVLREVVPTPNNFFASLRRSSPV
ncbi:fibronectin type III domain-containing protein [Schlesneria paludicola]|uniref:fibronectin type III domain-containing protein n=1 Tax=Schlesneria paludicola TaxID=360056 RepID=UPI00029AEE30|nr:peptidase S8 and S53 subtilisin kexin sedolisin [Schlesneria paludicola]